MHQSKYCRVLRKCFFSPAKSRHWVSEYSECALLQARVRVENPWHVSPGGCAPGKASAVKAFFHQDKTVDITFFSFRRHWWKQILYLDDYRTDSWHWYISVNRWGDESKTSLYTICKKSKNKANEVNTFINIPICRFFGLGGLGIYLDKGQTVGLTKIYDVSYDRAINCIAWLSKPYFNMLFLLILTIFLVNGQSQIITEGEQDKEVGAWPINSILQSIIL